MFSCKQAENAYDWINKHPVFTLKDHGFTIKQHN